MRKKFVLLSVLQILLFITGCEVLESSEQSQVSGYTESFGAESNLTDDQSTESNGEEEDDTSGNAVEAPLDEVCFITEENGKRHVLIYSTQQIQTIIHKREQGQLAPMSADTIKRIIEETLTLFESNDIIQIHSLDGQMSTYYGLPFYRSKAYLDSFGIVQENTPFLDYKKSLCEVIFKRIEVLHPSIYDGFESESKYVFAATSASLDIEATEFQNALFNVYELGSTAPNLKTMLANYPLSAFFFDLNDKRIGYIPDISRADPSEVEQLLPDSVLPSAISPTKYDYNGKVVVIELYENDSRNMIARLRFDEKQNPDIISEVQKQFDQFLTNFSGSGNAEQSTNYRAVVYLNGFPFNSFNDTCIIYCPDGDINLSNFSGGYNIFQHNIFFQKGCQPLTQYINELLQIYLTA